MSKYIRPAVAGVSGVILLLPVALLMSQTPPAASPFLEKPYLQLGDSPKLSAQESLVLMWHTDNTPADWMVEVRASNDSTWRAIDARDASATCFGSVERKRSHFSKDQPAGR